MGSFFTNVHVRRTPSLSLETLESTLDNLAQKAGMIRCAADASKIDRSIVIHHGGGKWISIYDEATEDQDSAKLRSLGKALSEATESSVVSILVHDSDILQLGLYEKGKRVDQYDSNPGYFSDGETTDTELSRAAGKPKRWKHLLAPGMTPEMLANTWGEQKLFAEQTLARTAELLDCSPRRMGVGYRYLERDKLPAEEIRVLSYVLAKRPAYETLAEGPPHFGTDLPPEYAAQVTKHELAMGDELRIGVTCRNGGGPGTGVSIRVWGEAIDKGLVIPRSFELLVGNPLAGAKHEHIEPVFTLGEAREKMWFADRKKAIPAGVRGGLAALAGGGDWRAMQQAMFSAQVHVNVVGNVKSPGNGRLFAALFPMGAGQPEAFVSVHDLHIDPPMYRPLRANASDPAYGGSHLVRPLSQRRVLVGMVVYGVDQAKAAAHAAQAFEVWAKVCPPVTQLQKGVFHSDTTRRPSTGKVKMKNLFADKRWKDIVLLLQNERQVTLEPHFDFDGEDDEPGRKGYGLAFGRPIFPADGAKKRKETPALMLWAHVDGLEKKKVQILRETLRTIMDDAMRDHGGMQAFMTRWGQEHGSLDFTLYEQAVGIQGPETMLRPYASRWLRAVGNDTLWLGPDLRARLDKPTEAALSDIGKVVVEGSWLRLELPNDDNDTVRRVEEHLQALLPTAEQARAFAQGG